MMAAEAGGEEGGPAAAGSGASPAACRVKLPVALPVAAAPCPGLPDADLPAAQGGGAAWGPGGPGTGPAAGVPGGAVPTGAAAAGPAGDTAFAKGALLLPSETLGPGGGFPPLPLPPQLPPSGSGLGTVDEGDSLDGPEYEEEEVAIPLTAPPTNQ